MNIKILMGMSSYFLSTLPIFIINVTYNRCFFSRSSRSQKG